MSWFYRFFTKSDDESTVSLTSGTFSVSGNESVGGNLTVTGNTAVTGNTTVTGYLTVGGTERISTRPIYLSTSTMCIDWGTSTPSSGIYITGTTLHAPGSLYIKTDTGSLYVKTDHASGAWALLSKAT